jgi:glyoxylase I family protein
MKIEHVAINVADPVAMAGWYVEHLGLSVVCKIEASPYTHFLGDTGGYVTLEIYNNPVDQVPLYAEMDPLILHLAFESGDPGADAKRLMDVGASWVEDVRLDDGSYLVMLRDPWGLALQLCKRAKPMLNVTVSQ